MELPQRYEFLPLQAVYRGYALVLAADHMIAVYVHTLVSETGLSAVFALQGAEIFYFRLSLGNAAGKDQSGK